MDPVGVFAIVFGGLTLFAFIALISYDRIRCHKCGSFKTKYEARFFFAADGHEWATDSIVCDSCGHVYDFRSEPLES